MAHWFANLMQQAHARSRPAATGAKRAKKTDLGRNLGARSARYAEIVRMLRDREADDRNAREKRLSGYRQSLESSSAPGSGVSSASFPIRSYRFPTKVPCRVTPEARLLLEQLSRRYTGATVTFRRVASGQQAVMLTGGAGTDPKLIGWVEHCVQSDPQLCHVRNQGLSVETEGDAKLVLRFHYPATAVRMSSGRDSDEGTLGSASSSGPPDGGYNRPTDINVPMDPLASPPEWGNGLDAFSDEVDGVTWVDFTEIRPALDIRAPDEGLPPRLVMLAPRELEMMSAAESRDFEAFYVRLKHEVLGGIWSTLSSLLTNSPSSHWHRGSYYTVVREPDATDGRIHQKTVDDSGGVVNIGLDRTYDASAATDILVLYLAGDILADIADIYFTIQSLGSADTHFLKEEFFTLVRRFWTSAQSLTSPYGGEPAAVVRMSLRVVPTPVQVNLLKEDWTNLRQILVDRYGESGQGVGDLLDQYTYKPCSVPLAWPFAFFPAGEINVGLRLVYRQEWRHLGSQRGEVIRSIPLDPKQAERVSTKVVPAMKTGRTAEERRSVQTAGERSDSTRKSNEVVDEAVRATAEAMRWPLEVEGSIHTGVYGLAARTDVGLEAERRESSRHVSTHLSDTVRRMASRIRNAATVVVSTESESGFDSASSIDLENPIDDGPITYVYSKLQNHYEVLTRLAEIRNVVMVAENLPTPEEIDFWWVKQHDWVLAKVLLDESFRDALDSISQEARTPDSSAGAPELHGLPDRTINHLDTFAGKVSVRADSIDMVGEWRKGYREIVGEWDSAHREPPNEPLERLALDFELDAKRDRLYEHLRGNILHYQRAIWQQEDPQQRSMRYRKWGRKIPVDWRFELASPGALTIEELGDRLSATNVDGQFAAYSGGREVDLDQVIDPAGPIGYYGNYAVYYMRPEFASEDLFSMLHFFKSPYLRPNPETGKPEVADPVLVQISEDPTVAAVSDQVIEQNCEEMLRYVPELRLELARARQKLFDGTDLTAADNRKRQCGALRRQYAEYLFRKAQSRRVVLDTQRLVIDVIGGADSVPGTFQRSRGGLDILSAPGRQRRSAVAVGRGAGVLSRNARRDAEAEPLIVVRGDAVLTTRVLRGAGTAQPDGAEAEPLIVLPDVAGPRAKLVAGAEAAQPGYPQAEALMLGTGEGGRRTGPVVGAVGAHPAETEPLIVSPGQGEPLVKPVAGSGAVRASFPETEAAIVIQAGERLTMAVIAGAAASRDRDGEPSIVIQDDERLSVAVAAAAGAAQTRDPEGEPLIVMQGERLMTGLIGAAGATRVRGPDEAPLIAMRDDEGLVAGLIRGAGAAQPAARGAESVFARRADDGRATGQAAGSGAVRAVARGDESVIAMRPVDELVAGPAAGSGAGQHHEPERERVIVARGDGGLITSPMGGPMTARPPDPAERVIAGRGDGGMITSPVAVAGAARARDHEAEPGIVVQGSGRIVPSLVAGAEAVQARHAAAEPVIAVRGDRGRMLPPRYFDPPALSKRSSLAGRR